ncbi:MAG TPA: hypothetical protein VLF93_01190 [Candidatus Saccharimonadales bacterium]|nr:hypothetical protein [Candidatus Saccharimonadales bacterium]
MSVTGGLKKKIKGQVEQLKREINQAQGKDAKGGLQKVTGKVQEKMGDLEFNNSRRTT